MRDSGDFSRMRHQRGVNTALPAEIFSPFHKQFTAALAYDMHAVLARSSGKIYRSRLEQL
jgi:hypothetical protein